MMKNGGRMEYKACLQPNTSHNIAKPGTKMLRSQNVVKNDGEIGGSEGHHGFGSHHCKWW